MRYGRRPQHGHWLPHPIRRQPCSEPGLLLLLCPASCVQSCRQASLRCPGARNGGPGLASPVGRMRLPAPCCTVVLSNWPAARSLAGPAARRTTVRTAVCNRDPHAVWLRFRCIHAGWVERPDRTSRQVTGDRGGPGRVNPQSTAPPAPLASADAGAHRSRCLARSSVLSHSGTVVQRQFAAHKHGPSQAIVLMR